MNLLNGSNTTNETTSPTSTSQYDCETPHLIVDFNEFVHCYQFFFVQSTFNSVCQLVIIVGTIFFNALLIALTLCHKGKRTAFDDILVGHAFVDGLTGIVDIPLFHINDRFGYWPLSPILGKKHQFTDTIFLSFFISSSIIVATTRRRILAIVRLQYQHHDHTAHAVRVVRALAEHEEPAGLQVRAVAEEALLGHGRLLGVWHKRMGAHCVRQRPERELERGQHEHLLQRDDQLRHLVCAAHEHSRHMRVHLRGAHTHGEEDPASAMQELAAVATLSPGRSIPLHHYHGKLLGPMVSSFIYLLWIYILFEYFLNTNDNNNDNM